MIGTSPPKQTEVGVGDGQGEDRGDRRVRGVPAALEDLDPGRDGGGTAGHDRTVLARGLPVSGVAWGQLGHRGAGGEDTDHGDRQGSADAMIPADGSFETS